MTSFSSVQLADTMSRALEACDLDMIMGCYTDDAQIEIIDKDHPPSSPLRLQGKQAIANYYKNLCGQNVKHHISQKVVSDFQLALTDDCQKPDGTRLMCAEVCELSDGQIQRQTTVQAWD